MDYTRLGNRIRAQRKLSGMTQEELASAIGVSCSFIGHIERGSRKLSVETLVSICNALQISSDLLLQDSILSSVRSQCHTETRRHILREIVSRLEEEMD